MDKADKCIIKYESVEDIGLNIWQIKPAFRQPSCFTIRRFYVVRRTISAVSLHKFIRTPQLKRLSKLRCYT